MAERSPRPRGGIPLGMSIPELPLPGQGTKRTMSRHGSLFQARMLALGAVETTRLMRLSTQHSQCGQEAQKVNVPEPDTGGTEVPWAQQRRFPADGPMAIRWPMPSGQSCRCLRGVGGRLNRPDAGRRRGLSGVPELGFAKFRQATPRASSADSHRIGKSLMSASRALMSDSTAAAAGVSSCCIQLPRPPSCQVVNLC